jgi:polar amino acid transport system permease protein
MGAHTFGWSEFLYLLQGLKWTVILTVIAFAGGSVAGLVVAIMRVSRNPLLRMTAALFIYLVQGTPLLVLLFIAFFGLSLVGASLPGLLAAAIVMTIYAAAFLGEIWRGCFEAVPGPQWMAGRSLALTRGQQLLYVIIPQAARIAVAPTVGFLVQIVKNTSVTALIGFIELARAGQLVHNATFQPGRVFLCVAALYFSVCFPLSMLARNLEVKLNVGRATVRSA